MTDVRHQQSRCAARPGRLIDHPARPVPGTGRGAPTSFRDWYRAG
jgi:hypothetical protein